MKTYSRRTLFGCMLLGLLATSVTRADDSSQRFFTEGLPQLGRLEELTARLKASIDERDESDSGVSPLARELVFQGDLRLDIARPEWDWKSVHPKRKKQLPIEVVRGTNAKYSFRIVKATDRPFTITAIESPEKGVVAVGPRTFSAARSLSASWLFYLHSFAEWTADPGFKIMDITEAPAADARKFVCLRATYDPALSSPPGKLKEFRFTAEIYFDPANHWHIAKSHTKTFGVKFDQAKLDKDHTFTCNCGSTVE